MKMLKKLALVTAVATVSSTSFALEQLDDDVLAQTTGQDGITITITPDSTKGLQIDKLLIHDNDGLASAPTGSSFTAAELGITASTAGSAGAIILDEGAKVPGVNGGNATTKGLIVKGGSIDITVDTDGGGSSTDAFVNANIKMSGTTDIGIGKIQVAKSKVLAASPAYNGGAQRGTFSGVTPENILGALSLKMNGGELNVQLGAQPQGAMVKMKSTLLGGLSLSNLEVIDSNGYTRTAANSPTGAAISGNDGSLLVKKLVLTDATTGNLTMNAKVDIDSAKGIVIEMESPTGGYYGYMTDVGIGDGTGSGVMSGYVAPVGTPPTGGSDGKVFGDVEIVGLDMGKSTIAISGH